MPKVTPDLDDNRISKNFVKLARTQIVLSPETRKKNPNSLRFLIADIIRLFHKGNQGVAAKEFAKYGGRYIAAKEGHPNKTMNLKALYEILKDEDYVQYWHLESISRSVGVPAGALLFLSKAYSLVRDGDLRGVNSLAKSLRQFADHLEVIGRKNAIDREDFEKMRHTFDETFKEPELFEATNLR